MKRHFQRLSLDVIVKRGFTIISALILCLGLILPLKVNAADQPALKISWIYFRSNTQTNNTGGNTTDQAWLIYNFEFDKPYTGTMRSILSYTCGYGYVPYMMVDGVYYTVQTTVTNNGTTSTTRENTFDFVLTDTKSFKIIITIANTYLNYGGITTPSMELTASDGSGGSGVDYTNILTDILGYTEDTVLSLDEVNQHLAAIEDTSSDILDVLNEINDSLGDYQAFFIYHDMPEYQKYALRFFLQCGYTWNFTSSNAIKWGWALAKPTNLNTGRDVYLTKGITYNLVYLTNSANPGVYTFTRFNTEESFSVTAQRKSGTYTEGNYFLIEFTVSNSAWYTLSSVTNATYIEPLYLGPDYSLPDELTTVLYKKNIVSYLQDIVALFTENNAQNDQMIDQLDDINHDTDTITQQIDNLNTDFNNALSDVPINETLQEINNLNSAFQTVNGWWSQLWNALGVIRIIIILAMILMLIRIFLGRSR